MKAYQLKITLLQTKPPVWRRILIPTSCTFQQLHEAIQILFGWQNRHNFDFYVPSSHCYLADDNDDWGNDTRTYYSLETTLQDIMENAHRLVYTYDYGDNWKHQIVVEKTIEDALEDICLLKWKGDNLAEDAGNVEGYQELVRRASNRSDPDHEDIRSWLNDNHLPFVEEVVKDGLNEIGILDDTMFTLSQEASFVLNDALMQFREQLDHMSIPGTTLLVADDDGVCKVMLVTVRNDDYHIQLYESEQAFLRAVEHAPKIAGLNIYADGIFILALHEELPFHEGWCSDDGMMIVKRMSCGYTPYDLDDEEAFDTAQTLTLFLAILQNSRHAALPSYEQGYMVKGIWSKDGNLQLSYGNVQLMDDVLTIHLSFEQIQDLGKRPAYDKSVRIDLIGVWEDMDRPSYDVLFIAENEDFNVRIPLHSYALENYDIMNEDVASLFCGLIAEEGRMKAVLVNNENMANMLGGICEDLKIPLRIEDFITEAQKESLEQDLHEDFDMLSDLAGMSEQEFYEFLNQMDEEELHSFSEMIEQYMKKYGIDELDEGQETSADAKPKRHFDA